MLLTSSCCWFGWCKPYGGVLLPIPDQLGCTALDAMYHDLYKKPFMWYLVKCLLKVQVYEVHAFVVTRVISVNDTCKEVARVKRSCKGSYPCFWSHVESHLSGCCPQGAWLSLPFNKSLHHFANYRSETNWSVVSRTVLHRRTLGCRRSGHVDLYILRWFSFSCTVSNVVHACGFGD